MDLVASLDRTFEHAHHVIAGVTPDQFDQPTPCAEWTVRDLLDHVVGVVDGLGRSAAGTPSTSPFELADDPAAQFDAAATTALEAWRAPA